MRLLVLMLVAACASPVLAQQPPKPKPAYIQKREVQKQRDAEYRKKKAAEDAETAKWNREYDQYAKTGALPADAKRAETILKLHEQRLKNMEAQARVAALQPKGQWVWAVDPLTGRLRDKWIPQEEYDKMTKPKTTISGTISPWGSDGTKRVDLQVR